MWVLVRAGRLPGRAPILLAVSGDTPVLFLFLLLSPARELGTITNPGQS